MVWVDSNVAMSPPPHFVALSVSDKDALLAKLWAENEALKAQVAELQKKLGQPAKTPQNSSIPPSRGQKANAANSNGEKRTKACHPGVARPLAEDPDQVVEAVAHACPHCASVLTKETPSLNRIGAAHVERDFSPLAA
ncbi:MAG: DUF6444 domain-containing protein [Alphaproteobacteria bacterium]